MNKLNFNKRISIVALEANKGPKPCKIETEFTKAWTDIKTMKGYEYDSANMAGNKGLSRFIIRYIRGIKPTMKIKYNGLTERT